MGCPGSVPADGNVVIRVLLADDQALVRAGFSALLTRDDIEVVGQAEDGRRAIGAHPRSYTPTSC